MGESRQRRMIGLLLFDPFGILGLFFLMLGIAGAFIYGVLVAYEHISIYNWTAWAYPLVFIGISLIFLWFAFCRIRRGGQRFIREIKKEEQELRKRLYALEKGEGAGSEEALEGLSHEPSSHKKLGVPFWLVPPRWRRRSCSAGC